MREYDHRIIEDKWQKEWKKTGLYKTESPSEKPKSYILDMFPYPSGEGLHVGHPKGYIATDIYSRHKKMNGFNVLHPMGWDAFGLPAENYAIENKVHPREAVTKNIKRYKKQLGMIGFNYDWDKEINTTDPEYYKWTQWIFLKLYEKGLAFESYEPINWCPSCQTGLANEDLEDGKCERCGSEIEQKPMRQWVLKITDYAERLLDDLDKVNWPKNIKELQRNWIGRSEGLLFTAPVKDTDFKIETFSTHFEAFHADTFVVIAPEHNFLKELVKGTETEKEVLEFSNNLTKKRLKEGYESNKEPEGIFTGRYIIDPVGNGDLPIWVANYAIADYGTGIVKASCHDERDFSFAKKYEIKMKPVLFPEDKDLRKKVEALEICFTDMKEGVLSEPKEFEGKKAGDNRKELADLAIKLGLAQRKITYKLRDWVFSRQRYWGEPIPIIHCEKCGVVPVPEKDLPVSLPEVENYAPSGTGESPLVGISDWVNTTCPECGGSGKRETNTMPQWAGSSWYYLRFIDPQNGETLVDKKEESYWMKNGIDMYVGGAEHATRHLIYARFWHKFLYDINSVSEIEPFRELKSVGLILGNDGRKMSKRWGNVINPDEIIDLYGADTLRIYEMFMGPFNSETPWATKNMIGSRRFIEKIWRLTERVNKDTESDKEIETLVNQTIKKVGEDIENFSFNTAISSLMILVNSMENKPAVSVEDFNILLRLLAPFAPHIAEELWQEVGGKDSIYTADWPKYDNQKIISKEVSIAISINGKARASLVVERGLDQEKVKNMALNNDIVKKWLADKKVIKEIFVPDKLLNFVVQDE